VEKMDRLKDHLFECFDVDILKSVDINASLAGGMSAKLGQKRLPISIACSKMRARLHFVRRKGYERRIAFVAEGYL